ncbi:terminase [Pseudomonas nitroreducens]|uniref:Terminase n=1 Tax=Pseudomonas nitroreducens TaxID=46680 RepID=A0A5R8ZQ87_PSENT|nr:terminase [Pseudomonas nitroreducens]TLP68226.1 terminase [Pseudomonas nitroreducens]
MAAKVTHDQPLLPLPKDAEELARCLADPEWRVFSGCLYKIMIKGDDRIGADGSIEDGDSFVLPFKPNRAQRRFISRLWHRNLILKARQLGFTTLICILWLDHALFNADQRCGIIAQDLDAAGAIFRDKVQFAYRNLPDEIRERFPLARDSQTELLFAHNNSSIRVATSMRSGTIHRLHVSEFGKICAKYPDKAQEVVTGSIPAVPTNGVLVIESTAEGREGEFFEMVETAEKNHASKKVLTAKDYRFHFYAWWQEPKYRLDSRTVPISRQEHEYFDTVEAKVLADMGQVIKIDPDQRAWYIATKRADFKGKEERMWQEYPSFPAEAFQVSTEGNYYARDMIELRKRNGVTRVPRLDLPVNTFWDIGRSDGTAIWFHQELRGEDRFIDYYEAHNEDLRHYVKELRDRGYVFGTHYLPHDAEHRRLGDYNRNTQEMLQDLLPGEKFVIVPRITELITGIYQTRKHLKGAYFDEAACSKGIQRIEGYRKKFNRAESRFINEPDKSNGCSEGADALRQWGQAKELGMLASATQTDHYEEADAPDWRL